MKLETIKPLSEASYRGNIGMMEMFKFYQKATSEQKAKMKQLLNAEKFDEAWAFYKKSQALNLRTKMLKITGQTLFAEQLLAEELKKKGFIVESKTPIANLKPGFYVTLDELHGIWNEVRGPFKTEAKADKFVSKMDDEDNYKVWSSDDLLKFAKEDKVTTIDLWEV